MQGNIPESSASPLSLGQLPVCLVPELIPVHIMMVVAELETFCNSIMLHIHIGRMCWHAVKNLAVLKTKSKPYSALWLHHTVLVCGFCMSRKDGTGTGRWGYRLVIGDSFLAVNAVWTQNRCLPAENAGSLMSGSG